MDIKNDARSWAEHEAVKWLYRRLAVYAAIAAISAGLFVLVAAFL